MLHSWESWKPLALLVLLSCTLGRAERKRGRDYGAGGRLLGGGVQGAGGSALPKEPGPSLEQLNVCDLVSHAVLRTLNIYCNCDAREPLNASSATCWLFNEGEKPDSRIWDAFKSQENILQLDVLIRANNSRILNYIPTKGIRHLKKLKVLEILYGNIDVLPKFAFANLTQLQDLSLARNEIMRLEEFSVANLPELIVITLGENRIQEIGKFVFVNLPSLRKLYIDRNNISVIHEGAFAYLENLEELELYQNRISHLTREAFKGLAGPALEHARRARPRSVRRDAEPGRTHSRREQDSAREQRGVRGDEASDAAEPGQQPNPEPGPGRLRRRPQVAHHRLAQQPPAHAHLQHAPSLRGESEA
ncbi:unnamed protein product [Bemisia tabaci]|uniref:Connectin n=1 Tax=Bemisia tabaci TaxID=7038 RepID=A0A9P0A9N9_BEMTA|nr:unnamed protein product [Bemisia tabaci]